MEEIWKPVGMMKNGVDYSELYHVSNMGNVKGLKRGNTLKPHILRLGYGQVELNCPGTKPLKELVHRLVAMAFIPNDEGHPNVLHKIAVSDGGSDAVDNLYWGDQKQNCIDAVTDGNMKGAVKATKRVELYDPKTLETIEQFPSMAEAARRLGGGLTSSGISKVANGKWAHTCNKHFRFY
jgi:hypothetical protein